MGVTLGHLQQMNYVFCAGVVSVLFFCYGFTPNVDLGLGVMAVELPRSPIVLCDFVGVGLHSFCPSLSTLYRSVGMRGRSVMQGLGLIKFRCGPTGGEF